LIERNLNLLIAECCNIGGHPGTGIILILENYSEFVLSGFIIG